MLAAVLAGCSGGGQEDGDSGPASGEPTPHGGEVAMASESDSLLVMIELPSRVAAGEPIPITLRAENVAGRPLDLYLRGRDIAFDVVVTDEGGTIVWRRLEDEVIPAILRVETLPAGGALTLTGTWEQRSNSNEQVPPGLYSVRGEILTEEQPIVTPEAVVRIGEVPDDS